MNISFKHFLIKFFALCVAITTFLILQTGCGKDASPSPMYQKKSSKIQKEIESRKQLNTDTKKENK